MVTGICIMFLVLCIVLLAVTSWISGVLEIQEKSRDFSQGMLKQPLLYL